MSAAQDPSEPDPAREHAALLAERAELEGEIARLRARVAREEARPLPLPRPFLGGVALGAVLVVGALGLAFWVLTVVSRLD